MTTIYVAGPMTGLPEHNYPAFHAAAVELRDLGYSVLNPAEIDVDDYPHEGEPPWSWYMRRALEMVAQADGVALLRDWQNSRGARLEKHVADGLWMPVRELRHWIKAAA